MKAWLIYNQKGASENKGYIKWFMEEAAKKNIIMELVIREELMVGVYNNKPVLYMNSSEVKPPDVAIVRTIDPLLSLHLEGLGISVFNSAFVSRICNHKGLTHYEVQKLHVPMVDTYFYSSHAIPVQAPLPYPVVIKNVSGRGGNEVYYIQDDREWKQTKEMLNTEIIVQSTDVQLGKDLRVYVIGDEIIAAVLRESTNDFRANYTLGGGASLYSLNDQERTLIHRIIHQFNFDLVGIDFLIGKNGELLFNEIEDIVGSRTLSMLTDINLLEKYTEHIISKWNAK